MPAGWDGKRPSREQRSGLSFGGAGGAPAAPTPAPRCPRPQTAAGRAGSGRSSSGRAPRSQAGPGARCRQCGRSGGSAMAEAAAQDGTARRGKRAAEEGEEERGGRRRRRLGRGWGPGAGRGARSGRSGRSGRSEARCGGRWPRCCPARRGGRTRSGARGAGRPRASPLSPGSFQPAAEPLGTTVLHAAVDTRPQPLPGEGSGRAALSPPPTHPDPIDPVPARCLPSAVLRHRHHGARQLLPVRPGGAAGLASQQR